MKHARKLASLLLALVMAFALAVTAFAQDVPGTAGNGSITISNAAKGETYTIYKLFDATVNADGSSIAYTGKIPESLNTYFTADKNGYISATKAAKDGDHMSAELQKALKAWTATEEAGAKVAATAVSDGSALTFKSLVYGYYVVTTTQGEQAISVDSTMPNVTIVDKNKSTPSGLEKKATGTATDKSVSIGDKVTYTVSFKTSNYSGAGKDAKKIVSYTIKDTLPEFLKDVTVTSIIVDNDGNNETPGDQTKLQAKFDENKQIVIEWYDEANNKFLYNNGATIIITYTAVVTDKAAIDGNGNANKVTVTWATKGSTEPEPDNKLDKEEIIYTYAIALKKVNNKGEALSGAVFQFPFYVKSTADADGAYIYAGITGGEGLTNQITTPENGVIVVKGVKSGSYEIKEVTAPAGYNKLTDPVTVTAAKTGQTSTNTTVYLDKDGNVVEENAKVTEVKVDIGTIAATAVVVVNKAGAQLPSTGGMGTTIFYVLGSVLVIGAVVLLVTKKRMSTKR